MRSWFTTFMALAAFAVLVAWVTHWLDSARPRSSLHFLRQFMARWKETLVRRHMARRNEAIAKLKKTPEAKDPPEGDRAA